MNRLNFDIDHQTISISSRSFKTTKNETDLLDVSNPSLRELRELLHNNSSRIRCQAIAAIEEQVDREDAIEVLEVLLFDKDSWVCSTVIATLGRLKAKEALFSNIDFLISTGDTRVRYSLANVLNKLGTVEEILPLLSSLLRDENSRVRCSVIATLANIESSPESSLEILELLRQAMGDSDREVRSRAFLVLSVKDERANLISHLITLLSNVDVGIRSDSLDFLVQLGAKEAGPEVLVLLGDENPQVRSNSVYTVRKLLGDRVTVDLLKPLLNHPDKRLQSGAHDLREVLKRKLYLPKNY